MSEVSPSRIVVKVGTSTLTDAQGRIDRAFIADLTAQLAAQRAQGLDVILVTSGAIRAGREALGVGVEAWESASIRQSRNLTEQTLSLNKEAAPSKIENRKSKIENSLAPDSLPFKQAAAAIGQGLLMHTYTEAFAWRKVQCAQILLTRDDLSDRRRFLNARNTLLALLSLGVVPVINENDTVAVDEIKFGDNDTLAALVATLVEADLLLILSDVEGLYQRPPATEGTGKREEGREEAHPNSPRVGGQGANSPIENRKSKIENFILPTVRRIDEAVEALAGDSMSGMGTGGMKTKIEAARIATQAGIRTVIARGRRERVIADVVEGKPVGTTFLPRASSDRLPARKGWIAHSARPRGSVTVNPRAKERLLASGVSLLAVGVVDVTGGFTGGDLIEVRDETGEVFARGLTNYAALEVRRVLGLRSEQFEEILGYRGFEEIIHRDNLVIFGGSAKSK